MSHFIRAAAPGVVSVRVLTASHGLNYPMDSSCGVQVNCRSALAFRSVYVEIAGNFDAHRSGPEFIDLEGRGKRPKRF